MPEQHTGQEEGPAVAPSTTAGSEIRGPRRASRGADFRDVCSREQHGAEAGRYTPAMVETVTAVLLIVVPIAFNLAFFSLGRAFDYPDILRAPRTRSFAGSMPAGRG